MPSQREITHATNEMQHFARELFLLARQCGAAGLSRRGTKAFWISTARLRERSGVMESIFFFMAREPGSLGWRAMGLAQRAAWIGLEHEHET